MAHVAACFSLLLVFMQAGGPPAPKLSARLVPLQSAVSPGGNLDVLLEVEIPKPWHLYHPILLGPGLPTVVELTLPEGATAEPVRFPAPDLRESKGIEYLGYEGSIALPTRIALAPAFSGAELAISARLSGLACTETTCVPVDARAALSVPVAPGASRDPAGEAQPVFDKARRRLSSALESAPYLTGSALEVRPGSIPVGRRGELVWTLKIKAGHHIQDPRPGVEGLIGTRIFIEPIDGLIFEEPIWPQPKVKKVEGLGEVREHSGPVAVRVPFRVADLKFEPRTLQLHTLVYYQSCSDAGECYAPEMAEAFARFVVVPGDGTVDAPGARSSSGSGGAPGAAAGPSQPQTFWESLGIWGVFLFAFLGGALLNVMPCVLPVISLKIFSFLKQAGESRGRIFLLGVMYTLGVLVSFLPIAILVVAGNLAWGGLMQDPRFVITMAAFVFAFGLSLLGVFELRLPGAVESAAGAATTREGVSGAFLNGAMATLLATPCLGPGLGWAIGVLVAQPPLVAGLGIMTVGLGLAAPFLLLSAFPAWLKFVPRPGMWMVTFKQVMGFLLLATAIWLLWIVQFQVKPERMIAILVLLLGVALGCWLLGQISLTASGLRTAGLWGGAIAAVLAGLWVGERLVPGDEPASIEWRKWEPGLAERLSAEGYTVYVDFTARWCATCQTNKNLVLLVDPVLSKLRDQQVVMLKADFTNRNDEIQRELQKHQRAGVPLNIVFPAGRPADVIVLPELLTGDIVLDALKRAGPSQSAPAPAVGLAAP